LNGAGHTRAALVTIGVTLAIAVGANWAALRGAPADPVFAAALATAVAMACGLALVGWVLWRAYGSFLPPLTLVRVSLAVAAGMGLGRVLPSGGKLITMAECALIGLAYLAVLVLSREISGADLGKLRALRSGGKSA
jgi:hypothetical protein